MSYQLFKESNVKIICAFAVENHINGLGDDSIIYRWDASEERWWHYDMNAPKASGKVFMSSDTENEDFDRNAVI